MPDQGKKHSIDNTGQLSPLASRSTSTNSQPISSTTAAAFAAAAAAVAAGSAKLSSSPDCFNTTPPPSRSRDKPTDLEASRAMHLMLHPGNLRTPTLGGIRSRSLKYDENKENSGFSRTQLLSGPPPKLMSPASSSPLYEQKINDSSLNSQNLFMKPSLPLFSSDHLASQSRQNQFEIPSPADMPPIIDDGTKPPYSYATLIGMAILRSEDKKLTLSQIYKWINDTFMWYRKSKSGWQNSIRHNLSLNKAFKKQERPKGDPGKGNYWLVEPGCEHQFLKGRINKRPSTSSNFSTITTTTFPRDSTFMTSSSTSVQYSSSVISPLETLSKNNASDDDDSRPADKKHYDPAFNEELTLTPLKRSKTVIGLQHLENSSVSGDSPTRKRGFDITDFPSNDTTNNMFKKKRLNIRSVSDSLGRGSSFDTIPNLNAPPTSWLPYTNDDGVSMTQVVYNTVVSIESPVRTSIGSGLMVGKNLTVTPKRTQLGAGFSASNNSGTTPNSKFLSPSPFKAYKNLGCHSPMSYEFEDIYPYSPVRSSPSRQRFGFYKEEDDLISRACFGSPDKRAAKRRDYFEYSGGAIGFDGAENATDVFGVDICQVVKRAVQVPKPGSKSRNITKESVDKDETDDENTEDEIEDSEDAEPKTQSSSSSQNSSESATVQKPSLTGPKFPVLDYHNSDAEKFLHYDSPIKTQSSVFSPQKMSRRDYS